MLYSIFFLSIIVAVYNYNKLIKHNKDIKTFAVISIMLITAILYTFFLDDLRNYSLLKVFKIFSEFSMPRFVEFMKT